MIGIQTLLVCGLSAAYLNRIWHTSPLFAEERAHVQAWESKFSKLATCHFCTSQYAALPSLVVLLCTHPWADAPGLIIVGQSAIAMVCYLVNAGHSLLERRISGYSDM